MRCLLSILVGAMLQLAVPRAVDAQIALDGSVGPAGALSGPDFVIRADQGRQVGPNLFHSFRDFNVRTGESATFTGPSSVENIIGRVTGGNTSVIDGRLHAAALRASAYDAKYDGPGRSIRPGPFRR